MLRRPTRMTHTGTRFPHTTLFLALCELRRFPRHIDLSQAQAASQGTRAGGAGPADRGGDRRRDRARALGCDVGLLSGYGRAQMGAFISDARGIRRSEENTTELPSLMRTPYAVLCVIQNK